MEDDGKKFSAKTVKNLPAKIERTEKSTLSHKKEDISTPPNIPTFDLTQLNLLELTKQLQANLNKEPSFFIFLKAWNNEKLQVERERIQILYNMIEDLRLTQKQLIEYQADTFLSQEMLQSVIGGRYEEAKREAEIKIKEHENNIQRIEDEKRARQIQLDAGEIANLRAKAEVNLMEAKTKAEHAKAELIEFVVKNINFKDMPQILQTFVVQSIVNPNSPAGVNDLELQQELKEIVKRTEVAKARIIEANADKGESEAKVSKVTSEKTVTDIRKKVPDISDYRKKND